jgi:hypothetical protein
MIPEPDLKVRERTIPAEDLDHKSKDERNNMNDLYGMDTDAQNSPEDQKDDPEEMDQYNDIGKYPEEHYI